jgi:hypothetical protein
LEAVSNIVYGVGEKVVQAVWANISTDYPYLVQELGQDLLNYTSPDLIRVIASQLDTETLNYFVEAAVAQAATNGTSRIIFDDNQHNRHLQESSTDDSLDWLPTMTETRLALSIGGLAAIFAAMSLAIVWIPSSVSTIQQFRCGKIGSLRDSSFQIYRDAPDLTTILFGSTFWATFYSSLAISGCRWFCGFLPGLECHTLYCCQFACELYRHRCDAPFQDYSSNFCSQNALRWILSQAPFRR